MTGTPICMSPIAYIRTPFPDKYGVPRQPGLVPSAIGRIPLSQNLSGAADDLEGCSHVWLLWWFHGVPEGAGRNKVRPPRLGGNRRKGVLATRSPFRPNPIGLSVCPLIGVERSEGRATIVVGGVDLVDKTPILDIKPYVPYVDEVPNATVDWVPSAPAQRTVSFDPDVQGWIQTRPELRTLIEQVLAQDPRPATHRDREDAE
ncbi:MAG: tRNA (N6-threonylcarbamoyladenosine(37)-N6)-methyltransferase TrmO, partial [Myxococcota bacterium]